MEVNVGWIFTETRTRRRVKYSWRHYSPRLKRTIFLVYTHEVISTKSERKLLKSTIWLTDQNTRKIKNRSLQNFQTWQFTSLSLRKQQRNGLNGTVKSLNCFLTWEEKKSFVVFCWLAKFIAEKFVVLSLAWSADKNGDSVPRGKTSSSCIILSRVYLNVEFLQTFTFKFVCHK